MKVSDAAEVDTHAIVGGGAAQAFEIDNSPEFFTVLSDTLYRDKRMAVVREIVCNAWDAHIKVGKTDKPVEITFTDGEMSIRDFGPGIPDELIVPVYCRYGASTKVKDDSQTGGFGLGSKAPFAYSDHFTVTNCHAGYRTVYAISRGGTETDGKPDIRAMVRVPTEETGITVSVPLKSDQQQVNCNPERIEFEQLVRKVVFRGAINATMNGEALTGLDFTDADKSGFLFVCDDRYGLLPTGRVHVRYGSVLYPIDSSDAGIVSRVNTLGEQLFRTANVILVAKPGSVGVTPSREALSFTEKTTKTISDMIDGLLVKMEKARPAALHQLVKNYVDGVRRDRLSMYFLEEAPFACSTADIQQMMRSVIVGITRERDHYHDPYSKKRGVVSDPAFRRSFFKACARKFRDERHYFRRAFHLSEDALANAKGYERYPGAKIVLNTRYQSRLLMRLANRVGLLGQLYDSEQVLFRKRLPDVAEGLILARTREQARQKIDSKPHLSGSAILALTRQQQKLIPQIRELSAAFKIALTELSFEAPPRKPRVKVEKPKEKFVLVTTPFYKDEDTKTAWLSPTVSQFVYSEAPTYFIRVRGGEDGFYFDGRFDELRGKDPLFKNVVFAFSAEHEKKLVKLGVINVIDAAQAELVKMSTKREVLYAFAVRRVSRPRHGFTQIANHLAKRDLRIAKLLFPDRVKITDLAERSERLIKFLAIVNEKSKSQWDIHHNLIKSLDAAARKEFPQMDYDGKTDHQFSYLHLFSQYQHRQDGVDHDMLLDTLKFLRGRQSKSLVNEERKAA